MARDKAMIVAVMPSIRPVLFFLAGMMFSFWSWRSTQLTAVENLSRLRHWASRELEQGSWLSVNPLAVRTQRATV